jgi:hypothetical protein
MEARRKGVIQRPSKKKFNNQMPAASQAIRTGKKTPAKPPGFSFVFQPAKCVGFEH